MEYMESRMQDQIEGALHSQQEAMGRIAQLESDLATAEQDSRQKQARIERLEKIVSAAQNLVKVKGSHHSEIAYQRLVDALKEDA